MSHEAQFDTPAEIDHDGRNKLSRVILSKTDDKGKQQLVDYDGVAGEKHTKALRIQPFGFSSHAPAGSEGIVLSMANRDTPVVLGLEHPDKRPTELPEGATKLYDADGNFVYLDNAGNLHAKVKKGATIEAGEGVTVKAKKITLEGDVEIKGNVKTTGNIESAGVHKAADHT